MITQNICLSSVQLSSGYLDGTYDLKHHSSMGVKYASDNDVKITYSDKITNFVGGRWRIAKNSSPYTLYYANPSQVETVPLTGWISIAQDKYTGSITLSSCEGDYNPVISPSPTPSFTPSPTPLPTPTPTPTISMDVGLNNTHNELTEYVIVKGIPTVNYVSHLTLKTDTEYSVLLTGYSMNYTTNVYLSCNNDAYPLTSITPPNSKQFDNFMGMKIEFDVVSENELIIRIPKASKPTILDVVITNPAGYGKLTPTYEPISTEWLEHNLQHSTISINN